MDLIAGRFPKTVEFKNMSGLQASYVILKALQQKVRQSNVLRVIIK
jgi:hypothetical protein